MRFEGEEAPEQRFIGTIVGIEDCDPHNTPSPLRVSVQTLVEKILAKYRDIFWNLGLLGFNLGYQISSIAAVFPNRFPSDHLGGNASQSPNIPRRLLNPPKICNLETIKLIFLVGENKNILRLQVAVDNPQGVQIRETLKKLISVECYLAFGHLSLPRFDQALQRTAGGIFQKQIVHRFVVIFKAGIRAVTVNEVRVSSQGI
nr:auxin response factor 2A-like [Ipomoea batatas]